MKTCFRLLAFMLVPALLIGGLLNLVWLLKCLNGHYSGIEGLLLLVYNLLGLPILLIVRGSQSLRRYQDVHPLGATLVAWIGVGLLIGVSYLVWGATGGNLFKPDPETVLIVRLEVTMALGLVSLAGVVWLIMFWRPLDSSLIVWVGSLLAVTVLGRLLYNLYVPAPTPAPLPPILQPLTSTVELTPGARRTVQLQLRNTRSEAQTFTLSTPSRAGDGGAEVVFPHGQHIVVEGKGVADIALIISAPPNTVEGQTLPVIVEAHTESPVVFVRAVITVRIRVAPTPYRVSTVEPAPPGYPYPYQP